MDEDFLLGVQGNILIPFPRHRQAFLFFNFRGSEQFAQWLADVSNQITLTADLQQTPTPDVCCGLGITAAGVAVVSQAAFADLKCFVAFERGSAARSPALRDREKSSPEHWVFGSSRGRELHAVLLLASTQSSRLEAAIDKYRSVACELGGDVTYRQDCAELEGAYSGREHFGFRDGISQPFVWNNRKETDTPVGEFVLGRPRSGRSGRRPAVPHWMLDGSFQVIRRLNQDVVAWRGQIDRLWRELGASDEATRDLIAAKLIGRWASGAPLATSADRDDRASVEEGLDFDDDPEGFRTPRFSHIRKMLPRMKGFPGLSWRRIIRRSVPFGRPPAGEEDGSDRLDRGLLMNAYMADIEEQFEFLIQAWANDPDFPEAGDGPDPLIGRDGGPVVLRRRGAPACPLNVESCITTTGGAYLFAPSAAGLKRLVTSDLKIQSGNDFPTRRRDPTPVANYERATS